jgi:ethanolamine utilization protein EutN
VGAGTDERVLVVTGSSARKALGNPDAPVDAAIVGIIDEVKIRPES